jgi:hypothetical protein
MTQHVYSNHRKENREVQQLGMHTDNIWTYKGGEWIFDQQKNSQSAGTPTAVFTIGDVRHLRMAEYRKKKKFVKETATFHLTNGSLFLLHPDDEKPQRRGGKAQDSYLMHGGIKYGGDDRMSIAMIFRVTSKSKYYSIKTGRLKLTSKEKEKCEAKDELLEKRLEETDALQKRYMSNRTRFHRILYEYLSG